MPRTLALAIIVLGFAPWVWAVGPLTPDERNLLLAQIEDLCLRLKAEDPAAAVLPPAPPGLELKANPEEDRALAGISLVRRQVSLIGGPDRVLPWLVAAVEARLTIAPPLALRQENDRVAIEVPLWWVRGGNLQRQADDNSLTALRDNLLWLEQQQASATTLLELLAIILDPEAVLVHTATLQSGTLTIRGSALDAASRQTFVTALQDRAARFPKRPGLDLAQLEVLAAANPLQEPGIELVDLEPHDAVTLLASLARIDVIVAGTAGPPLHLRLPGTNGEQLLLTVLDHVPWQHRLLGRILVAADNFSNEPLAAAPFGSRALSLQFVRAEPANILSLLAEISHLGLLPPEPSKTRLTLVVRQQPAALVARSILWALGLSPAFQGSVMAPLPTEAKAPEPSAGDEIDLAATQAPLADLVAALSGAATVTACAGKDPLRLRLGKVSAGWLLQALLLSRGLELVRDGPAGFLIPIGAGAAALNECKKNGSSRRPALEPNRILAVLGRGGQRQALLPDGGFLRWAAVGTILSDGSVVYRIDPARVLLHRAESTTELRPEPPEVPLPPPTLRANTPLSRLRLAGVVRLGNREGAMLVDPHGDALVVRPGQLLGRRCGKVTAILPGAIQVTLGCPGPADPKEILVPLRPANP